MAIAPKTQDDALLDPGEAQGQNHRTQNQKART
jgi:hypothetical protein